MKKLRKLTLKEENLIDFLIKKENLDINSNWKKSILAFSMNDGNMGSLKLYPDGLYNENREYKKSVVSECEFKDNDGTNVIASLFLDKEGNLFELDIWKVDFSELLSLPDL
ncbi:MAG: hypothetical protein WCJ62_10710 [Flavobacterium sp.]